MIHLISINLKSSFKNLPHIIIISVVQIEHGSLIRVFASDVLDSIPRNITVLIIKEFPIFPCGRVYLSITISIFSDDDTPKRLAFHSHFPLKTVLREALSYFFRPVTKGIRKFGKKPIRRLLIFHAQAVLQRFTKSTFPKEGSAFFIFLKEWGKFFYKCGDFIRIRLKMIYETIIAISTFSRLQIRQNTTLLFDRQVVLRHRLRKQCTIAEKQLLCPLLIFFRITNIDGIVL